MTVATSNRRSRGSASFPRAPGISPRIFLGRKPRVSPNRFVTHAGVFPRGWTMCATDSEPGGAASGGPGSTIATTRFAPVGTRTGPRPTSIQRIGSATSNGSSRCEGWCAIRSSIQAATTSSSRRSGITTWSGPGSASGAWLVSSNGTTWLPGAAASEAVRSTARSSRSYARSWGSTRSLGVNASRSAMPFACMMSGSSGSSTSTAGSACSASRHRPKGSAPETDPPRFREDRDDCQTAAMQGRMNRLTPETPRSRSGR